MPPAPHIKIIAIVGILVGIAAVVLGIVSLSQTVQSLGNHLPLAEDGDGLLERKIID